MSDFEGMARVSCVKSRKGALNCICFIERYRNAESEMTIVDNMEYRSFWEVIAIKSLPITLWQWIKGKKSLDRKESTEYIFNWWMWNSYKRMYKMANDIIFLVEATDKPFIYLSPEQARIINNFSGVYSEDITADFNNDGNLYR